MARKPTQINAVLCAYEMWRHHFRPASIINVGVSSAPEYWIWKWLYPEARLLGIDVKRKPAWWEGEYKSIAVTRYGRRRASFCHGCHSFYCQHPEGHASSRTTVRAASLDSLCNHLPAPYFLWIDVEGAELDVLRGGQATLKQAPFINLEFSKKFGPGGQRISNWLRRAGYRLVRADSLTEDRLYHKRGWTSESN